LRATGFVKSMLGSTLRTCSEGRSCISSGQ
jgi:hypothetical protein